MSDYGDFCREQRQRRQAVRRSNEVGNWRFTEDMIALGFTMTPVGAGWRFSRKDYAEGGKLLRIDFWPSTGKWNIVGTPDYMLGGSKMVRKAKALTTKEGNAETRGKVELKPKWTGEPSGPNEPPWEDCPCALCKEK